MGGRRLRITNTEVWGFAHAVRGMRNPMNSWDKSDSQYVSDERNATDVFFIGTEDLKLMQRLIKAGGEHSKFMRMIHVSADVDMPRYWWSEADTYHFNTKNSCSTMHKLLNNNSPITKDLFVYCEEDEDIVNAVVARLETLRQEYKSTNDYNTKTRLLLRAKRLLMEGFLQLRTWDTNYAEIRNMYHQRKNHRLKEEWVDTFCKWVENLPYSEELITGELNNAE